MPARRACPVLSALAERSRDRGAPERVSARGLDLEHYQESRLSPGVSGIPSRTSDRADRIIACCCNRLRLLPLPQRLLDHQRSASGGGAARPLKRRARPSCSFFRKKIRIERTLAISTVAAVPRDLLGHVGHLEMEEHGRRIYAGAEL